MNDTLPRMILSKAGLYAGHPVCRIKRDGRYLDLSWHDFEARLRELARGLLAAGAQPGDRIAIMAPNGPQWVWADLAAQACGAITVPVYHTEGLTNTLYLLADSGSRWLFIWSPLAAAELLDHLDNLPALDGIILLNGTLSHPRVEVLENFIRAPEPGLDRQLSSRLASGKAEAPASIVYTSGTTGQPKGVVLSHANFLANVITCSSLFDISTSDCCLSFLPLSHVFERMAGYYLILHQGATIAYAEGIDSVPANLREVHPTILISVPRLYEKMYARTMERVVASPWLKRKIFLAALNLSRNEIAKRQAGEPVPAWLRVGAAIGRSLLFGKLQEPLGGRLRFFVSGGAPLSRDIAEFFLAAGIPIYEGYGLTESSPVIAANVPGQQRLGTVGRPIPGLTVKIAADGEILAAGPSIFQGYWQRPGETAETLIDGWLHTGDIGTLDKDGYLSITDRKKSLIVTSGGENIAPQLIEQRLKGDKFIANALVCGDRRSYLVALLVPNFDNLGRYARMKRIDFLTMCDLVNHPQILALLRRRVEELQAGLPGFQKIKRFTLLSRDFSAESGEITPTQKIRRRIVEEKFRSLIEGMYQNTDHGIHDAGFCIVDPEGENSGKDAERAGHDRENNLA